MANRSFSIHPHGVFYDKDSEGALYQDNTSGGDKADDKVPPGGSHTYTWIVNENAGPALADGPCQTWLYHSHTASPIDTNTGLVGPMLICNRGTLKEDGTRSDVDKEFFLLFTIEDENLSQYLDENIHNYCTDPSSVDPEDNDFLESNRMRSINGYVFGHLPGIEMCNGDRVAWHIAALGTEMDIHTLSFHGNGLIYRGHREQVLSLSPAALVDITMTPQNPGRWLLTSEVFSHAEAGMQAFYTVKDDCGDHVEEHFHFEDTQTREFFIAAEVEEWNYAPTGKNNFDDSILTDPSLPQSVFFKRGAKNIGGVYYKAVFRDYIDGSFTEKRQRSNDEEHLGFLGPVIRAEAGDKIVITLLNNINQLINLQFPGELVAFDGKESNTNVVAEPGQTVEYVYTITESYQPTENDPQCLTYNYQSTVNPQRDVYSGLIGPLLICKEGVLGADGRQNNIDKEFFLWFARIDENESWMIDDNIREFAPDAQKDDEDFIASNLMEAVNGRSYSNLEGLSMCLRNRVNWHVMGLGRETDLHTIYFHGSSFVHDGERRDTYELFSGTSATLNMTMDNPGLWAVECMTADHNMNGLHALYRVSNCNNDRIFTKTPNRTYYIAAVESFWDYAPGLEDHINGGSLSHPDSRGNVFVKQEDAFIGSAYKKALFKEYTDGTFMFQKPQAANRGFLGPAIYIEEGETVRVVFKNMASRPYSIHAHGVDYSKSNEGVRIKDGVNDHTGVLPGEKVEYIWQVSSSRAPSDTESRCVPFLYYSNVDYIPDIFSGLVGPVIVCKRSTLVSGLRTDVDREFFLLFIVTDENKSWYLDENIQRYCNAPDQVDKEDGEFVESNLMHAINGRIYGNIEKPTMDMGETVEWYLLGLGNEVDIHSVHFHAQTVIYRTEHKHRTDVVELFPGVTTALRMVPDNPGEWLLHCHVNDHMAAGMKTTFIVNNIGHTPTSNTTNIGP